jgi:hypothetical protein
MDKHSTVGRNGNHTITHCGMLVAAADRYSTDNPNGIILTAHARAATCVRCIEAQRAADKRQEAAEKDHP